MKNIIITAIITTGIIMITSCGKPGTTPGAGAGGSWTVNSTTYTASVCQKDTISGVPGLAAAGTNTSGTNLMGCSFFTYPTASGFYDVIDGQAILSSNNQIQFSGAIGASGTLLESAAVGIAQVTMGSDGKLTVKGYNLRLYNYDTTSITYIFSVNLIQSQ